MAIKRAANARRWLDGPGLASEKGWPADVAELVDARDLKSAPGYPDASLGVLNSPVFCAFPRRCQPNRHVLVCAVPARPVPIAVPILSCDYGGSPGRGKMMAQEASRSLLSGKSLSPRA